MADITLSTVAGTTLGGSFSNMPAGVIVMWSGSIATIPGGFFLCDGTNGTPDLRNKFIIGAQNDTTLPASTTIENGTNTKTGGTKNAVVVSHTHTATQVAHSHTISPTAGDLFNSGSAFARVSSGSGVGNTGTAQPPITVDATGVSGDNANLPPYYALAFIMKG
jgi:hypothetical protein